MMKSFCICSLRQMTNRALYPNLCHIRKKPDPNNEHAKFDDGPIGEPNDSFAVGCSTNDLVI